MEKVNQRFPSAGVLTEGEALYRVLATLRSGQPKSTGKLHSELYPGSEMSRDTFEEVLGAMARAGLVRLSDAVFDKDGKQIPYRDLEELRAALSEFRDRYNRRWIVHRLGYRTPSQARNEFIVELSVAA